MFKVYDLGVGYIGDGGMVGWGEYEVVDVEKFMSGEMGVFGGCMVDGVVVEDLDRYVEEIKDWCGVRDERKEGSVWNKDNEEWMKEIDEGVSVFKEMIKGKEGVLIGYSVEYDMSVGFMDKDVWERLKRG